MKAHSDQSVPPETELVRLLNAIEKGDDARVKDRALDRLRVVHERTVDRLARARSAGRAGTLDATRLNDILACSTRVLYGCRRTPMENLGRWLHREVLGQIIAARRFVVLAATLLIGGFDAGFVALNSGSKILRLIIPPESVYMVNDHLSTGRPIPMPQLLSDLIVGQHMMLMMLLVSTGILLGVGPLIGLFWTGLQLGALATMHFQAGALGAFGHWFVTLGLPGVGIAVLSGAAGLALGWAIIAPGRLSRRMALARAARQAGSLILATFPLLALEALMLALV